MPDCIAVERQPILRPVVSTVKKLLHRLTAAAVLSTGGLALAVPECEYLDLPAALSHYDDWPYTLVDTAFRLPADYVPPDLVPLTRAGFADERLVRELLIADLTELRVAAEAAGHPIEVQSAYRRSEERRVGKE